ncbi:substrate-binding domain-containing protein [Euzebya tangerina]|uniref:substrate-binding domain-containing protein n=1 Tax=Euzebya tangerina TaxID=591198 RepID=UPI000E317FFF|nr:substrate-binding domain-containing protein [Euzebya tangerina]
MRRWRAIVILLLLTMVAAACTGGDSPFDFGGEDELGEEGLAEADAGDCITVDMAVSSEKIDLLTDLANEFNNADAAELDGECIFVRPQRKASGTAASLLSEGWDEELEGPRPVIWSPASSAWGQVLNQRLIDQGQAAIAPEDFTPFMLTPLVIAMPEPMAEALGYPEEPIGWNTLLELSRDPQGWAVFGHPEWGPFRLGKTNPNFSTSGLSALIAQYYALVDKTQGLTNEDITRQNVLDDASSIESAVVHYGDTTLTFLNNWYRNDVRGTALTYASAVAIEEVSLINYNRGNPDGVIEPGEEVVPPRVPLVAIYPEEGTLFSDNPFFILEDADWVDADQAAAAELFTDFVQLPENQERVLEFGFRPGNIEVPIADPIIPANGVDPSEPSTTLATPESDVMVNLINQWSQTRKPAQVLIVLDVSGSMGDFASDDGRETLLDLATQAATTALDQFIDTDVVGLRIFSTDLGADPETGEPVDYIDLVPRAPIAENREVLAQSLRQLFPVAGTPLYTVTEDSFNDIVDTFDPEKINAIVLLTDGQNDDPRNSDRNGMLQTLEGAQGENATQVRIFPIRYGTGADLTDLEAIAEATDATVYDSSDPRSIDQVFTAVISNF